MPDHRDRRLLRARDEWPRRHRRAADKRDELAPSHARPQGPKRGIV